MKEFIELSPSLRIPRMLIGLWQIADIERKQGVLDPKVASTFMQPYVENGFYAFDMADHYGSSEIITGTFKNNYDDPQKVKLFTKCVPEPGKVSREIVRTAVQRALDRMQQSSID